jgi:hypothetical protein
MSILGQRIAMMSLLCPGHFAGPGVIGPLLPEFLMELYEPGYQNKAFCESYPIMQREKHISFVQKPLYLKRLKKAAGTRQTNLLGAVNLALYLA